MSRAALSLFAVAALLGSGAFLSSDAVAEEPANPLKESTQLVVVTSASWDAPTGVIQRYQRSSAGSPWRKVGKGFGVALGKAGLGWRTDEGAPAPLLEGPQKKEGDQRSPAGIMPIGEMWGYEDAAPQGVKLPYHHATDDDRCVDDVTAPQYNKLLAAPAGGAAAPWKSAERMHRGDELYKYLIVVEYNREHPVPGAGSCIFLHLARGTGSPTVGCTAMSERDMLVLLRWLDPGRRPLLVQLPRGVLPAARKAWKVP